MYAHDGHYMRVYGHRLHFQMRALCDSQRATSCRTLLSAKACVNSRMHSAHIGKVSREPTNMRRPSVHIKPTLLYGCSVGDRPIGVAESRFCSCPISLNAQHTPAAVWLTPMHNSRRDSGWCWCCCCYWCLSCAALSSAVAVFMHDYLQIRLEISQPK